ncbi:hypothetical protein WOC76_23485 [Methylocystis sp. IM3]|uniref:hypothetical protein n=1 Tax=unclassified Methylocystis TaxID=2625913 RepID=UPI003119D6F9
MPLSAFALCGALCLSMALIEAWLLVALRAPGDALARLLPNRADLVRSHIDYLMMALFLFVFYGLCRATGAAPAGWLIAAACLGAVFNPFAFLVHAARPAFKEAPPAPFFAAIVASCVATTIGFAATAWTLAAAAVLS